MTKNTFLSAFEHIKRIRACEDELRQKKDCLPEDLMFRIRITVARGLDLSIELLAQAITVYEETFAYDGLINMIHSLLLNGEVSWYKEQEDGSETIETATSPEELWDKLLKEDCNVDAILDKTGEVIERKEKWLYE